MDIALIDGIDSLLVQLVLAFGISRLLPMRHRAAFCVANVTVVMLLNTVAYYLFGAVAWLGIVGLLALIGVSFVLPCVLYEGPMVRRVIAVAVAGVSELFAAVASEGVFSLLTGQPVPEAAPEFFALCQANMPAWVSSLLAECVILAALLAFFAWFFNRPRIDS